MSLVKTLIAETWKNKSLGRTLFNYELRAYEVGGRVLDLGSGQAKPSYYRFLKVKEKSEIITVDISPEIKPRLVADLERALPLESGSFDNVLAFNLLEHIYNYKNCLNEANRVLKKDGKFYGVVPFLAKVHADPSDYFRYTGTTLTHILKEAGFSNITLTPLGFGPFTAAYAQIESYMPRLLRLLLLPISIVLDRLPIISKPNAYPLGYLFVCQSEK